MCCKFSDTSVTIRIDNSGAFALVRCEKYEVKLELSKEQILAYNMWIKGDPDIPSSEQHGSPPNWWYKGLIERAKKEVGID